jgi:hypothetical protein
MSGYRAMNPRQRSSMRNGCQFQGVAQDNSSGLRIAISERSDFENKISRPFVLRWNLSLVVNWGYFSPTRRSDVKIGWP